MKILYIGGTGNISTASSRLAIEMGMDLYLLNRGTNRSEIPGARTLVADHSDLNAVKRVVDGYEWDVVVNWIAFTEEDVKRDYELFMGCKIRVIPDTTTVLFRTVLPDDSGQRYRFLADSATG